MQSNWWMTLFSALEMLSLAGAIAIILWRNQFRKWPFLFLALAAELALDMRLAWLLLYPQGHYKAYFYNYWVGGAVISALRMGVFYDLARSFRGISALPRIIYIFVTTAGLTMALASMAYCYHEFAPLGTNIRDTAVLWNRCVNIFMATFLAVILGAIKLFNIGWSRTGAQVVWGLAMRTTISLLCGELYSLKSFPITKHIIAVRSFANGLETFVSIAVLSFWVFFLARCSCSPKRAPEGGAAPVPLETLP